MRIFVHHQAIESSNGPGSLKEGQRVSFVTEKGAKVLQATQVRPL
ncbi:cold-shock protein [Streptomyces sp. NPDC054961]